MKIVQTVSLKLPVKEGEIRPQKVKGQITSDFCLWWPIRCPQKCFLSIYPVSTSSSNVFHTAYVWMLISINVIQGGLKEEITALRWKVRRRRRRRWQKGALKECVATQWLPVMFATKSIYIPVRCRSSTPVGGGLSPPSPQRSKPMATFLISLFSFSFTFFFKYTFTVLLFNPPQKKNTHTSSHALWFTFIHLESDWWVVNHRLHPFLRWSASNQSRGKMQALATPCVCHISPQWQTPGLL